MSCYDMDVIVMISATWRFPPKNRDIDVIAPVPGARKCLKSLLGPVYACIRDIMYLTNEEKARRYLSKAQECAEYLNWDSARSAAGAAIVSADFTNISEEIQAAVDLLDLDNPKWTTDL